MPDLGQPMHRMTTRELHSELGRLIAADPTNVAWDDPFRVDIEDGYTYYSVELADVTDMCDGSCHHPQCVYAATATGQLADEDETADVPDGYTDEGLHFRVVLWANKR